MDYLQEKIKNDMRRLNVAEYDMTAHMETVSASGSNTIVKSGPDRYYIKNIFTSAGVSDGSILADNDSMTINPLALVTEIDKHRMFKGRVKITNNSSNTLYVEFVRVTPVKYNRPKETGSFERSQNGEAERLFALIEKLKFSKSKIHEIES